MLQHGEKAKKRTNEQSIRSVNDSRAEQSNNNNEATLNLNVADISALKTKQFKSAPSPPHQPSRSPIIIIDNNRSSSSSGSGRGSSSGSTSSSAHTTLTHTCSEQSHSHTRIHRQAAITHIVINKEGRCHSSSSSRRRRRRRCRRHRCCCRFIFFCLPRLLLLLSVRIQHDESSALSLAPASASVRSHLYALLPERERAKERERAHSAPLITNQLFARLRTQTQQAAIIYESAE